MFLGIRSSIGGGGMKGLGSMNKEIVGVAKAWPLTDQSTHCMA